MEKFLTVAKIVKPQGIKGEVKVLTMTDSSEDLSAFTKVYIGGNAYKLLKSRPMGGDCAVISLSGVCDRNSAELLRGMEVEVKRDDAPKLPEGKFYIADVIGCSVEDTEGNIIGKVASVTPARTDIYEVEREKGRLIFPSAEGVIESIDVESGKVVVNSSRLSEVALEEK
ncbi:MAG: ribosome maturation factor RimM [Candidatus Coproplasma sp.]